MSTTTSAPLSTVYCTDEDILIRDPDDFSALCPAHQCLARGADGAFAAGFPWVLTSASADFGASGVVPGNVAVLRLKNVFEPSGEAFGIAAAATTSLTVKRAGPGAAGLAPGPASGAAGVSYEVLTLYPQIEAASFDLNRAYSIDPSDPARSPDSLADLRDLRLACVLSVLVGRYGRAMRTERGDYPAKYRDAVADLSAVRAALSVRWAPVPGNILPPAATRFSMRLSR